MSACTQPPSCPPQLNSDVGGLGVRISFYLQGLFLACLSARGSLEEIKSALYTLLATNIAMTVTTAILGFKSEPEITLQDAIVVLYLLGLSWIVVVFSLPSYNSLSNSDATLKYFSIVQSYAIFTLAFAVLVKADAGFGAQPDCNYLAKVTVFRPFDILPVGRVLAIVLLSLATFVYTASTVIDYIPPKKTSTLPNRHGDINTESGMSQSAQNQAGPQISRTGGMEWRSNTQRRARFYDVGFDGPIIIELLVTLILWAFAVLNTELLIKQNKFQLPDESQWQFGQILTLFLVVLPCTNVIRTFQKKGLWKDKRNPTEITDEDLNLLDYISRKVVSA